MPDTVIPETAPAATPYRNRSTEIAKLAAALCKAQASMAGAKKDTEAVITGQTKRTYADLASVWDAVRKPLTDNGLSVVQFPRTAGNGVEIETTLLHISGEYMCDVLWVPCSKNDAQGLGSAITYGRRYALMAVTGVAPIDDDGQAAVDSHKPGTAGMASGGTDFRPPGPRKYASLAQSSANGRKMAEEDPQLVDHARPKGILPVQSPEKDSPSAVKRVEWVKKAIDGFNTAQTKDELQEWWKAETDRLGVIETAMPAQYERLLAAYDAAIDRTAQRGA